MSAAGAAVKSKLVRDNHETILSAAELDRPLSVAEYEEFLLDAPVPLQSQHNAALEAQITKLGFMMNLSQVAVDFDVGFVSECGLSYINCPACGLSSQPTDVDHVYAPRTCASSHMWWGWSGKLVSPGELKAIDSPTTEMIEHFIGPKHYRKLLLTQLKFYIEYRRASKTEPDMRRVDELEAILKREQSVGACAKALVHAKQRASAKRKSTPASRIGITKRRKTNSAAAATESAAESTVYPCAAYRVWKKAGVNYRFKLAEVTYEVDDDDDDSPAAAAAAAVAAAVPDADATVSSE